MVEALFSQLWQDQSTAGTSYESRLHALQERRKAKPRLLIQTAAEHDLRPSSSPGSSNKPTPLDE